VNENLLRFKKNQLYLTLDVETENLNICENNRPWQIGCLLCRGKEIEKKYEANIWWEDLNIGEEAARITRFNYENYKASAQDPKEVFDKVAKYLYDPSVIVVGQNLFNFDNAIINNWRRAMGMPADWNFVERTIDIRALFSQLQKENKSFDWSDPYSHQIKYIHHRERGLKTSLAFMRKYFGMEYDPNLHHSALQDVIYTWEVFSQQLIYQIEI